MKKFGVVQLKVWHDQRETTMWIEPDSTVFINGQQQPATGAHVTDTIAFTRAEVKKIHDFTKPFTGRKTDSINKILEAALVQRKAE
jgi:hypothetical protein